MIYSKRLTKLYSNQTNMHFSKLLIYLDFASQFGKLVELFEIIS